MCCLVVMMLWDYWELMIVVLSILGLLLLWYHEVQLYCLSWLTWLTYQWNLYIHGHSAGLLIVVIPMGKPGRYVLFLPLVGGMKVVDWMYMMIEPLIRLASSHIMVMLLFFSVCMWDVYEHIISSYPCACNHTYDICSKCILSHLFGLCILRWGIGLLCEIN